MQPLQFKCVCAPDLGENELLPGQANFHVDKQTDHTAARLLPVSKWRQQESNCRFEGRVAKKRTVSLGLLH